VFVLTGTTLYHLLQFSKHVYEQASLREELKNNKPPGVTDLQIDLLLNNF